MGSAGRHPKYAKWRLRDGELLPGSMAADYLLERSARHQRPYLELQLALLLDLEPRLVAIFDETSASQDALSLDALLDDAPEMRDNLDGGIYLLRAPDGRWYIGMTGSFATRYLQHEEEFVNAPVRDARQDHHFGGWSCLVLIRTPADVPGTVLHGVEATLLACLPLEETLNVNLFDKNFFKQQIRVPASEIVKFIRRATKHVREGNRLPIHPGRSAEAAQAWLDLAADMTPPLRPLSLYTIVRGISRKAMARVWLQRAYFGDDAWDGKSLCGPSSVEAVKKPSGQQASTASASGSDDRRAENARIASAVGFTSISRKKKKTKRQGGVDMDGGACVAFACWSLSMFKLESKIQ